MWCYLIGQINELKAGVALSYITMGLGFVISIAYTPIMLRLLGQSEYGLYNLVASVVAYLGILNFGFGSAYIRYYSRYKVYNDQENIAKLNGMFLLVFSVIGLIAAMAGTVLVFNTEVIFGSKLTISELAKTKILMVIMVLNIALSFPNFVFDSHITANERFIFQNFLKMIKTIANPFLVLPVLFFGYGSIGLVVATTVVNISIEIANIIFCLKKLRIRFSFRQFDLALMREMTVFSSFVFINIIVGQINWNVDKLILGRFQGATSVAVYGLAAQLFVYYMTLSAAISSVFIPRINTLVSENNSKYELTSLFTKVGRVQFMLLGLVSTGFIFYGKEFIGFWAGPNYKGSFPILLLLMIPSTIPLIQNIGIEIQMAKNMHQFRSWLYLIIAIGNVIISIPLAKAYGGIGAAFGTALGQIIGNTIIINIYYHRKIGLDMKYFWKNILSVIPAFTLPIVVGLGSYFFLDLSNIKIYLSSGLVYIMVYLGSIWIFGMNKFERELVKNPFLKL